MNTTTIVLMPEDSKLIGIIKEKKGPTFVDNPIFTFYTVVPVYSEWKALSLIESCVKESGIPAAALSFYQDPGTGESRSTLFSFKP